ncbi:hypothetical protein AMK26_32750 [Streptomyces sp. CB03234]|uniref:hypothetical protein n=1 Tax=Streptomyces sp. (strain CB03234) TaxID=1703937 RepID=UPI00093F5505|nr:hypothetical protein [Streptomyces sp. CB03234]OKJ94587.1 hypothetical protein AMK26_32750 [Streptomyces sp. CB03234]
MSVFRSRREFLALTDTARALALTGCAIGSGGGGPAAGDPAAGGKSLRGGRLRGPLADGVFDRLREEHGTALF